MQQTNNLELIINIYVYINEQRHHNPQHVQPPYQKSKSCLQVLHYHIKYPTINIKKILEIGPTYLLWIGIKDFQRKK